MTMAQKRFTCYKFYTKVVHGVLTKWDKRQVYKCVDKEIGYKFPREEGANRVGFREWLLLLCGYFDQYNFLLV